MGIRFQITEEQPRCTNVPWHGETPFDFLRHCQTIFQSGICIHSGSNREFPLFCILTSIWDCLLFVSALLIAVRWLGIFLSFNDSGVTVGKAWQFFSRGTDNICSRHGCGGSWWGDDMKRWFHSWRLDELLHRAMLYKMLTHYKPGKSDGENSDLTHLLGPAAMPFTAVSEFTSRTPLWHTGLRLDHLCNFFHTA